MNAILSRLLHHLRLLPPTSPPRLQRLIVRLARASDALNSSSSTTVRTQNLVRLRGRLEELQEALDEVDKQATGLSNEALSWAKLRDETVEALKDVEQELTNPGTRSGTHSRTPSADLARRLPSTSTTSPSSNPALDAFLAQAAAAHSAFPSAPTAEEQAARRARELSEAYALFLLSTSPSSVLPPGESLASIFCSSALSSTSAPAGDAPAAESLEQRISTQLHNAYFDSFASTFSSPSSSFEAKRDAWARLVDDLKEAVLPLIPSRLTALDRPPSALRFNPRNPPVLARDDLRSKLSYSVLEEAEEREAPSDGEGAEFDVQPPLDALEEAADVLRRLCAPARDEEVASLASDIAAALAAPAVEQELRLVPLVRRTLALAAQMAADVQRFKRAAVAELATETDYAAVVREEGRARERKVVREMYGPEEGVRRATRGWVRERLGWEGEGAAKVEKGDVAAALVETLFHPSAVALPSFSSPSPPTAPDPDAPAPNLLPPLLLVPAPALFALQNKLQALVILACLVALAGPPSSSPSSQDEEERFVRRVWALLEGEIPGPQALADGAGGGEGAAVEEEQGGGGTKLAHLADEVLSLHRRRLSSSSPLPEGEGDEEARLRESVSRILRAEDPVYRLLKNRLREAVRGAVVDAVRSDGSAAVGGGGGGGGAGRATCVPEKLRSGCALPSSISSSASRPSSASPAPPSLSSSSLPLLPTTGVKGFDRPPFLRDKVEEVVGELFRRDGGGVWNWVEDVWGEVVWGEEGGGGRAEGE
ncbi:hypothetical protein JCM8097_007075 [Rhodosporidiobolus ruineniae]